MATQKHRVLIVGGGFGGVKAALELAKHEGLAVELLSERDHFRYYPSLYHTATGGLKSESSIPLNTILNSRIRFLKGTAAKVDREQRIVTTTDVQHIAYDTLVLALGVVTNYFGIQGLDKYSYGIKSMEEVEAFKQHLHQQLESEHKPDLHYVIVGAGPTGIELAGALPGYLRQIMANHGIKRRKINIDLIEAGPRLLPRSNKAVSRSVRRHLKSLGVKLYLGQAVQGETADALQINSKPLASHTVVWTAGMTNNPFYKANNFLLNERGKVVVNERLQAEPNVYVIGDNAATPFSGLAQTALHDAMFVGEEIPRNLHGKSSGVYKPKKPISVIPAGPHWAAVEWGKWHFSGWRGWLLREAADLVAFHDLEPWWKATEQWATGFGAQESCPTCAAKTANS